MIDPELQKELRARFNPDGSLLRRHQLRMLEMLKYIDKVCQENDIPYWLSSGTCLGAVRHGGFIPWDDDVDIEMLGKDYDRFVKIMENKNDDEYILQTHKNDHNYVISFAKLRDLFSEIQDIRCNDIDYKFRGIYIDVFPMDPALPKIIAQLGGYCARICVAPNRLKNKTLRKITKSIIYNIVNTFVTPLVHIFYFKKKENKCIRHRFPNNFLKKRYLEHIFPLKRMEFEGAFFNVPNDTDKYLTSIFGNYMELPAMDNLHTHMASIRFFDLPTQNVGK